MNERFCRVPVDLNAHRVDRINVWYIYIINAFVFNCMYNIKQAWHKIET